MKSGRMKKRKSPEEVREKILADEMMIADHEKQRQRELDTIETFDAHKMLAQLNILFATPEQTAIAKRWLKKHWSDGWKAAGGASGAPEETGKGASAL